MVKMVSGVDGECIEFDSDAWRPVRAMAAKRFLSEYLAGKMNLDDLRTQMADIYGLPMTAFFRDLGELIADEAHFAFRCLPGSDEIRGTLRVTQEQADNIVRVAVPQMLGELDAVIRRGS